MDKRNIGYHLNIIFLLKIKIVNKLELLLLQNLKSNSNIQNW